MLMLRITAIGPMPMPPERSGQAPFGRQEVTNLPALALVYCWGFRSHDPLLICQAPPYFVGPLRSNPPQTSLGLLTRSFPKGVA